MKKSFKIMMSAESSYWERLEKIILWSGLSIHSFANKIELNSAENIYRIKNGKNSLSRRIISLIIKKFPMINEKWLITGIGEMLVRNNPSCELANVIHLKNGVDGVLSKNPFDKIELFIPFFDKDNLSFEVTNNDMSPVIVCGDVVVVSSIDVDSIVYDAIYLVVTKKTAALKIVSSHKNSDKLKIAINRDNKKEYRVMDKGKVDRIFKVEGIIRKLSAEKYQ